MSEELGGPCQGFSISNQQLLKTTQEVDFWNHDTRSQIRVTLPNPYGYDAPEDDPDGLIPVYKAAKALRKLVDAGRIPPNTVALTIDDTGELISRRTNPKDDITQITEYLPLQDYGLPPSATSNPIRRSELIELARLSTVDLVAYSEDLPPAATHKKADKRYVFRPAMPTILVMWHEVQMLSRLPPHPSLALLDRVVVDEVTGSQLVGFTMRYVDGQDLHHSKPLFKLKWLRQLMQVVDDLNLKHGVLHQDVAARNLIVDPDTDSIVLIDFDLASRIGKVRGPSTRAYEREKEGRDDGMPNLKWLTPLPFQLPREQRVAHGVAPFFLPGDS